MKTKTYIITLLLAIAAAYSCSRIEIDTDEATAGTVENGDHVLVPFTTEAGAAETRVQMDGSTSNMVFSAGDQLMVYSFQLVEPSILTLKSGAGESVAVFEGDLTLASGKTEADLAGKRLFSVLIPAVGVMMGNFHYSAIWRELTVSYSKGAIDSDLEALVARTALYEGETTYEARKFSFRMLNSYVKMNVTVPSEESDLARYYTVDVTNDWHICADATCGRAGWSSGTYSSTVSGAFRASSATGGTLYMAVLADNRIRIMDDGAQFDEVDFSIAMDNVYKEYDLMGGTISKAIIEPGKGYTKSVTLRDNANQDVLKGQPESVRTRIMSTYSGDKNSNGYLSKYEAAQVKYFKLNGNTDLTDASFFDYFTGMTTVLPNQFQTCSNLTKIILPPHLNSIEESAFWQCKKLGPEIYIPSGITSIGTDAFNGCSSLSRILIPSGVTTIGASAFSSCTGMEEVVFETPAQVATIGESAFRGCSSLESFSFPHKVTAIADMTFTGCTSLKRVSMTSSVTSIGASAFANCKVLDDVYLPAQVTSIGEAAFSGCSGLKTIHMPNRLEKISDKLFNDCSSLTGITIAETVKSIGNRAFKGCRSLTTLTFPSLVKELGYNAIDNCSNLTTLYCLPTTPPEPEIEPQSNVYFLGTVNTELKIYVPSGSVSAYKNHPRWQVCSGRINAM